VFNEVQTTFASFEIFSFAGCRSLIEALHFVQMKRARTAAAENNRLPAGFVDHAIALQSARNANRFALRRISRDQFRIWSRTESLRAGNRVRRNQLHDSQSILPVGHEREL